MDKEYMDRKFAFYDDDGHLRMAQVKSMTMAKANVAETSRVLRQVVSGERKLITVISCRHWEHPKE